MSLWYVCTHLYTLRKKKKNCQVAVEFYLELYLYRAFELKVRQAADAVSIYFEKEWF